MPKKQDMKSFVQFTFQPLLLLRSHSIFDSHVGARNLSTIIATGLKQISFKILTDFQILKYELTR